MNSSNLGQIRNVAAYEFRQLTKSKVFLSSTIIVAIIILILTTVVPFFLNDLKVGDFSPISDENQDTIVVKRGGVISVHDVDGSIKDKELFESIFLSFELEFADRPYDEAVAERIREGQIKGAIQAKEGKFEIYSKSSMISNFPYEVSQLITTYCQYRAMNEKGLSYEQAAEVFAPPEVNIINAGGKSADDTYMLTYLLIMVLYISVMLYGQMVSVSVATEKNSRAMELLITSAKPNNLIFGKILGVGLAGLSQIAVWIIISTVMLQINSSFWKKVPMLSGLLEAPLYLFVLMFLFYILGYFMYAAMFGALGSLVSRVEDISATSTPVALLYVSGFLISMFGMMNPDSLMMKICSFIPFYAPMCMFVRVSMTDVSMLEVAISLVLTAATAVFLGWLSAKIYRVGVLMYGKAPSFKELGKIIKTLKNAKSY
ncbi:MAG TPA: ABC transporter permease [Clostridiales bacterium]|nr:ABC transporter permease [Clostridiales bacterium]